MFLCWLRYAYPPPFLQRRHTCYASPSHDIILGPNSFPLASTSIPDCSIGQPSNEVHTSFHPSTLVFKDNAADRRTAGNASQPQSNLAFPAIAICKPLDVEVRSTTDVIPYKAVSNLPPIPAWGPLFLWWIDQRQEWVPQSSGGFEDRMAVNGSLATQFGAWLTPHWPLALCFIRSFPNDADDLLRWVHLFDLWAASIWKPGEHAHLLSSIPLEAPVLHPSVIPTRRPEEGPSISGHAALEFKSDSGDPGPSGVDLLGPRSTLTVKQIEAACEANEVEGEYIKRLNIVFPYKYAYRNQLKKPKGGGGGYGHFTIEGFNGKWVCMLCRSQRELQDRKNALDHIWVLHCGGQRNRHDSQA